MSHLFFHNYHQSCESRYFNSTYIPIDFRNKKTIHHNVLYFTKWYIKDKCWLKIGITTTKNNSEHEATEKRCIAEGKKLHDTDSYNRSRYEILGCVKTDDAKIHEQALLKLCNIYKDAYFTDKDGKTRVEFFYSTEELYEIIDEYLYEHDLDINQHMYFEEHEELSD